MRVQRRVTAYHLVKFCPPAPCSGQRPVAVVDYNLECGHTLRLKHFGPVALRIRDGALKPNAWPCPVCSGRCIC
jgi:hypothetical protein